MDTNKAEKINGLFGNEINIDEVEQSLDDAELVPSYSSFEVESDPVLERVDTTADESRVLKPSPAQLAQNAEACLMFLHNMKFISRTKARGVMNNITKYKRINRLG